MTALELLVNIYDKLYECHYDDELLRKKQFLLDNVNDFDGLCPKGMINPDVINAVNVLNIALKTVCKDIDWQYTENVRSVKNKLYDAFFKYEIYHINRVFKDGQIYAGFKRSASTGQMTVEDEGIYTFEYHTAQQLSEMTEQIHPSLTSCEDLIILVSCAYFELYSQHIDQFKEYMDQYDDMLRKYEE